MNNKNKKIANVDIIEKIGPVQALCLAEIFVAREEYKKSLAQANNEKGTRRSRVYGEKRIKEIENIFDSGDMDFFTTLLGMTSPEVMEQIKKACPGDQYNKCPDEKR